MHKGQSAIERELRIKLLKIKGSLAAHDRGVLVGFYLSLFPIFPLPIFGLLVSLANKRLLKTRKLELYEASLINKTLWLASINSVLCIIVLVLFFNYVGSLEWHAYIENAWQKISGALRLLIGSEKTNEGSGYFL